MFLNILGLLHHSCPNSIMITWVAMSCYHDYHDYPSTPALQSCRLTRLPVRSGHSRATYVDLCLALICSQQTSNAKTMNSDIQHIATHSHIAIPLQGNQPLGGLTNLPFFCRSSSKATFLEGSWVESCSNFDANLVGLGWVGLGWVVVAGGVLWKFYGVFLASDCSESR